MQLWEAGDSARFVGIWNVETSMGHQLCPPIWLSSDPVVSQHIALTFGGRMLYRSKTEISVDGVVIFLFKELKLLLCSSVNVREVRL